MFSDNIVIAFLAGPDSSANIPKLSDTAGIDTLGSHWPGGNFFNPYNLSATSFVETQSVDDGRKNVPGARFGIKLEHEYILSDTSKYQRIV
jgi:hypothetical protein